MSGNGRSTSKGWMAFGNYRLDSVVEEYRVDLRDFEERRQEELQRRWTRIFGTLPLFCILETRQFDYKSTKNPLFGPLNENKRKQRLLENNASSPSTDVLRVRKDLDQCRRRRSESMGCTCHKLVVRRMSLAKVKEHLRERGKLPVEQLPASELKKLLRNVVEEEVCCREGCSCVQNEIGCHEDACSCWFGIVEERPSAETKRSWCGNIMYAYDSDAIHDVQRQ